VFFGTAPIGGVLTGWLSERGGTSLALLVAGGTAALATAAGTLVWRRGLPIERRRRSRPATVEEAVGEVPSLIA
jgi:hypothetical protein